MEHTTKSYSDATLELALREVEKEKRKISLYNI